MRTLILYRSKYGSTKQYAEWIAESVGGDIMPAEKAGRDSLSGYDSIVFGSYVRVGKVVGVDFISDNIEALKGKTVFLFIVSGAPPEHPDSKEMLAGIPAAVRGKAKIFQLRGRIGKLDFWDKLLMVFPRTSAWMKYRKTKSEEDRKEMERLKRFDEVDRGSIAPLLKELSGKGKGSGMKGG